MKRIPLSRLLVCALTLMLLACGSLTSRTSPASHASAPPPAANPTAAPSKASAPTPLIAALGASSTDQNAQADTVAILGLDGHVVAKAIFQPRKAPYIGNAATILQPEAQVGGDGVYYMDGSGVVRRLRPSGEQTIVATFPMTPEQRQAWYAVSPDGKRLLTGILTYPAVGPTPSEQPWQPLVGTWKFDLEQSDAGGVMHILQHYESANSPDRGDSFNSIFPVGWTSFGPVAMVGGQLATQNSWRGGPLYTVDDADRPVGRIGGGGCTAAHVLPSGLVPCMEGGFDAPLTVTVRDANGTLVWQPAMDWFNALQLSLFSDGNAITDGRHVATRTASITLPDGLVAQGWLDQQTIVGRFRGGSLSYARLDDAGNLHDLGFKGNFIGMVLGHL